MATGTVYLVGAGPGDPGLITVAGREALASADLVLYDALVNDALLDLAPPGARRCGVGKRAGAESAPQAGIEEQMVAAALAGKTVVRLKGGDPFVFGRGGEEALACRTAGVPFVVVPGVTSAIAGPAYAGIPVTQRGMARSIAVLTGSTRDGAAPDWAAVARADTIVVLMAATKLEEAAAGLMAAGREPSTPAAVIEEATLPGQRVVTSTLEEIAVAASRARVEPPALLVVGDVVALRESLAWIAPGPLAGRRVVLTMTPGPAQAAAAALRAAGAAVQAIPAVEVELLELPGLASALAEGAAWVVLPSRNAVRALFEALGRSGGDARRLGATRVAAAGPGTAEELAAHGVRADFVPVTAGSAGLSDGLPFSAGQRVLLLQSDRAPGDLQEALQRRGAAVDRVTAYRTVARALPDDHVAAIAGADAVVFASPSAVTGVVKALVSAGKRLPATLRLVAIGPTTAAAVEPSFGRCDAVASSPTPEGILSAVQGVLA